MDAAWVALSLADYIGAKKLAALLAHFGTTSAVLAADETELRRVPGVGPIIAATIRGIDLSQIEAAIPRWQAAGVRIITQHNPDYPQRLQQIDDPPPTLFIRGDWQPNPARTVAIVGTREPSDRARSQAQELGKLLAERGFCVISGLASGIDIAVQMAAFEVPKSYSMAVLGSGVLRIYPQSHQGIASALVGGGVLVSEVHPDFPPNPARLITRNRIISGLSDHVIIVETSVDGGAMHAARRARTQNRQVYVVDNPASGNRALIETGAIPIAPDLRGFKLLTT